MNKLIMVKYELKKVLGKTGGKIALLALVFTLVVACWVAAWNVKFVNENGDTEKGPAAVAQLKAAQKEWAGYLDEEKLETIARENARINATPEGQAYGANSEGQAYGDTSKDPVLLQMSEVAYGWKQGFEPVRNLMNKHFAANFNSYDYYTVDSVKPEQMKDFYGNRVKLVKDFLYEEESRQVDSRISDEEKAFFLKQYEDLETPFYYDYFKGWERLRNYVPSVIIMLMLILSYLVSGIFPEEFRRRTDAVLFTATHGRGKAVAAKVIAGFSLVTVIYWLAIGIFTAVVLLYCGADGGSCPVQMYSANWKTFYNITIAQSYLLVVWFGYLGCLTVGLLVMLISSVARSAVLSGLLPFVLFFAPSVLEAVPNQTFQEIVAMFPHGLLTDNFMGMFMAFPMGGHMVTPVAIMSVAYVILALVLMPLLYMEYRRKQIA